MSRVLFSPIGTTDPISNCRDGALLHICRFYKPDYVYMYLSKEMVEAEDSDHRYTQCLKNLGELIGHEFSVTLIRKPDLEFVQLFDAFLDEFSGEIRKIQEEHPDCEYLLNVSSGTPAMKSSLQILAALSDVPLTPIQVSTPLKKHNPRLEKHNDYDVELYWEFNDDNTEDLINRCSVSEKSHLLDWIKIQSIKRLIESYDYVAALSIAKTMVYPLSDETINYLSAAACRLKLDMNGIHKYIGNDKSQIMPIRNDVYRNIFEHLLNLQIKIKKEEYVDFLRGITPVMVDLYKMAVKKYCGIKVEDYSKDVSGVERWDRQKLSGNQDLLNVLNRAYYNFNYGPIYSDALLKIMEEFSSSQEMVELTRKLRDVETKVRNKAAHDIVSVTEDWVKHNADNETPESIFKMLKKYAMSLDMKIKEEYWNSYDDMNKLILLKLSKE